LRQEAPDPATLEEVFHAEWVRGLFTLAVEKLREDCMLRGRTCRTGSSSAKLDRDPTRSSRTSGWPRVPDPATQVTNSRLRAPEFRRIVLEKLREITATDHEFREEARSLLGVSG
jgi:hypothetical protein